MALNRKDFVASAAGGLVALGLGGRGAAAEGAALDITVTHYPAQDYALPVVVAQQLGYYGREGITINSIVGSEGGGTTVRNIAQGGLKLGQVATPAAIKAILAGEDLRIIGGGVQSSGTISWSVKKNSPIKTIHDLVGKRVGFTNPGSVSEALIKMCLTANKIDINTVNLKAAGGLGENLTLLNSGGLDAAFTVDPALTQHQDELRTIFFARDFVPQFLQTVWVADSGVLQKNTPMVAGFMRAWARAVDYTITHPIDAANRYAKVANADPKLMGITLGHEKPGQYFGRGQLTERGFAVVAESMRLGKLIGTEKLDLSKIVDQRGLPSSMRAHLTSV